MLTVQHYYQKVAYIEFKAENDEQAVIKAESIFKDYENEPTFTPTSFGIVTGNFSGLKPRIKGHWVNRWVLSDTACNAWGRPIGNDGRELKPPTNHGVKGGKARAKFSKRDKEGKFIK